MEDNDTRRKKVKRIPNPEDIKNCILKTQEPLVLKNILSWGMLNWSLNKWIEVFDDQKLDLRLGKKQCTKMPQWESNCELISLGLNDLLDDTTNKSSDTWMYFDYKHMKQCFKNKTQLLESVSWADFGFPEKNGKDSTIWIGTQGAYTPCHMDSYGCNIVAQVYGRKLWVMFPPSKTPALSPTRVPYEESSIYSKINFNCGLNIKQDLGEARVVELSPGDVLIVPRHWWHYVENMSTAISVNMWIPLELDDTSRLEESLVRFFVASTLKSLDIVHETPLLNPNEMDLLDETVDLRQISWCVDRVVAEANTSADEEATSLLNHSNCVTAVPTMSAEDLQHLLLKKCNCVKNQETCTASPTQKLSVEHLINAFCHPDVIFKVGEVLISMRKGQ